MLSVSVNMINCFKLKVKSYDITSKSIGTRTLQLISIRDLISFKILPHLKPHNLCSIVSFDRIIPRTAFFVTASSCLVGFFPGTLGILFLLVRGKSCKRRHLRNIVVLRLKECFVWPKTSAQSMVTDWTSDRKKPNPNPESKHKHLLLFKWQGRNMNRPISEPIRISSLTVYLK